MSNTEPEGVTVRPATLDDVPEIYGLLQSHEQAKGGQGVFMTIEAAFTRFPSLTTNRLRLRQIQLEDAEAIFATFSDEETMQFTGHGPYRLVDETRRFLEQIQIRYARREAIRWGITLKGENRVIGSCGFHDFDAGFHRAETGYELNRAFWNQGLMTEALSKPRHDLLALPNF